MENKPSSKFPDFDLSKKWTRVLREANKSTFLYWCWKCRDKRTFGTEEEIRRHFEKDHPDELVQGDVRATKEFNERLKSQAIGETDARFLQDETPSTKPPQVTRNPGSRSGHGSPRNTRPQSNPTSLTASQLHILDRNHSGGGPPARKKAAIGSGPSPTSSVRTDPSNRGEADGTSHSQPSPSKSTPYDVHTRRGGSTRGKRLFEPNTDSPFVGRNTSTYTAPRQQSSQSQPQPLKISQSFTSTPQEAQRPNFEPKPIPINILNVSPQFQHEDPPPPDPEQLKIVRQPETRPISQEQLVAEVKGIYAGLVMVEGKCIQVDQKQAALAREAEPGTQLKLSNEQWQALIALHRTLLHEHHDFFLASQHPSATPAVRRLAIKYAMPARLWRHGIHSFLELLRNRLPDSLDHMLAFIYLAYSMMTLLYETVPAFEDTWIECLGDLGRYRMAIEDDDIRDREVWTQVARQWYLKASDKQPATGRLYHHLAILARPNALQQLFFYGKALSVSQPFIAARESVLTLFEPVLNQKQTRRFPPLVTAFVKVNAIIFLHDNGEDFETSCDEFISLLDSHIARVTQRFLEQGYYIAISNTIALLSFGSSDSILVKALSNLPPGTTDTAMGGTAEDTLMFKESQQLFNATANIALHRVGDPNVLSFLHVLMVYVEYMSKFPAAMVLLEDGFPMEALVTMLNTLIRFYHTYDRIEQAGRPIPDKNDFRPCPEEFAMRGLFWALEYFPPDWFMNKNIEDENQYKEEPSMNSEYRPEMILWLAIKFARAGDWIYYDDEQKRFSIPIATPTQSPEKDIESRSTSATVVGDHDEEEMSFASQTSSRKSTFESGITDIESNWDSKTTRSEVDSQETSKYEQMDLEQSLPVPIEGVENPGKLS